MGTFLVSALLALVVAAALRSIWKGRGSGKSGSCGGDCSHCKGCH